MSDLLNSHINKVAQEMLYTLLCCGIVDASGTHREPRHLFVYYFFIVLMASLLKGDYSNG